MNLDVYRFFRVVIAAYWLLCSVCIRCLVRVDKKRILCQSFDYRKYACNPRYITEFLLNVHPGEYEIYWCFNKNEDISFVPDKIKIVRRHTWKYLLVLYSSAFILSNVRLFLLQSSFLKKKSQKYVMTWHGDMGLKKVEKDVEAYLPASYIINAKWDSKKCDLILSGCRFFSNIVRNAFWYNGEILEKGTPRKDILFKNHDGLRRKILKMYKLPSNAHILLYAPTFRQDFSLDYYKYNWDDVIPVLESRFGTPFFVLLRLHPNFYSIGGATIAVNGSCVIDVTSYPDIQELICVTDVMVTDYSSAIFDFYLLKKPGFIYAPDFATYDRGTYLELDDLPFPFARNDEELVNNIKNMDIQKFERDWEQFNRDVIGSYEAGHACEAFYEWMKKQN